MNRNIEEYEEDVERQWEEAKLDLAALPSAEAIKQVRAAVRHEMDERWLADQPQPLPDKGTLHRVRTAVRQEVYTYGREQRRVLIVRRGLAIGSAVAAAVLLSVGLPRLSPVVQPEASRMSLAADELAVERFVQTANSVWADDPVTGSIRDDLEAIEKGLSEVSVPVDQEPAEQESLERIHEESSGFWLVCVSNDTGVWPGRLEG